MRVLIADDDEMIRALLRVNLELAGHQVVAEAADGREALDFTESMLPDVIVLDMMMPHLNGRDVLRHFATNPGLRIPAIVAFSAAPSELDEALELGADEAILKDGDFAQLLNALDEL
jgi:CheY-like chemotaxis protein